MSVVHLNIEHKYPHLNFWFRLSNFGFFLNKMGGGFTEFLNKKYCGLFSEMLVFFTGTQSYIAQLDPNEAKNELKYIKRLRVILKAIEKLYAEAEIKQFEPFLEILDKVLLKIDENIYLIELVATQMYDADMDLYEHLEDFYDLAVIKERHREERVPAQKVFESLNL